MSETKQQWPPPMTDEELREFVDGYVSGRIFSSVDVISNESYRNIKESLQTSWKQIAEKLGLVFMPLMFGALSKLSESQRNEIALIWEWKSESMLRMINGMPTFASCRCMNREDWNRAIKAIREETERRKNIRV